MDSTLISVVMIFLDAEKFIEEAIQSVLDQDHPAVELILVDDGATDASAAIARRVSAEHACVEYVTHEGRANRGMSASRALGVKRTTGELVAFLDADDKWDEHHLSGQLAMLQAHPTADVVCAPSYVWESWDDQRRANARNAIPFPHGTVVEPPHLLTEILRDGGYAVPICSMLVRRSLIERVGGPVEQFRTMFEDQAFQAKLFLTGRAVMSSVTTAWYRQHPSSACNVAIQAGEYDPNLPNQAYRQFLIWLQSYVTASGVRDPDLLQALDEAVREFATRRRLVHVRLRATVLRTAPAPVLRVARRLKWRIRGRIPVGHVRYGDLRRVEPIDRTFGYDRGGPIDRYYIETFVERHADDIRGDVLEIGEDAYTRLFGTQVHRIDVLHIDPDNLVATVIADLADASGIADNSFDCLIVTQTLHLIYDLRAAVATLHRILKPGGVLLLTVPGITQQSDDVWGESWHWSLTRRSAQRLFGDEFGEERVEIGSHGNVLAAISMLHGLSAHELTRAELDHYDAAYEMIVTVRAVKRVVESGGS